LVSTEPGVVLNPDGVSTIVNTPLTPITIAEGAFIVMVFDKEAKTLKVLKWLTEAVIVWLTVSILTVVNCSHFPVDGLYQAAYWVEPAGTMPGS